MLNWIKDLPAILNILNIISVSYMFSLLIYMIINRNRIQAFFSIYLLCSLASWSVMHILEFSVSGIEWKSLFHHLKYTGILTVPGAWMLFVIDFTGKFIRYKKRLTVIFGFAYPAVLFIAHFSNYMNKIFWYAEKLTADGSYIVLQTNSAYLLIILAIYLPVICGFIFLFTFLRKIPSSRRTALRVIVTIGMLPLVFKSFDVVTGGNLATYDTSIISFGIISVLILFGVERRYSKNIPTAHEEIVHQTNDPVLVSTDDNRIIYANPAAFRIFSSGGNKPRNSEFFSLMHLIFHSGTVAKQIVLHFENLIFDVSYFPLIKRGQVVLNKVFVFRDITLLHQTQNQLLRMNEILEQKVSDRTSELFAANEILKYEIDKKNKLTQNLNSSLQEKRILLSELHHRVKNNLQIISSLLKIQLRRIESEEARTAFQTAVSRIHVIAMMHEKLYKHENFNGEESVDYLSSLIHHIINTYHDSNLKIKLDLKIESSDPDMEISILIGLIINELLVNSVKYAFSSRNNPLIRIHFFLENGTYCCHYEDNGQGTDKEKFMTPNAGMGSKIIQALLTQLKGKYELSTPDSGFSFRFSFPVAKKTESKPSE